MEINFKFFKLTGLFTGLLILFLSCSRKDSTTIHLSSKQPLETLVDEGSLLNNITQKNQQYLFHFETKTVSVPQSDIKNILKQPEQWTTLLTFSDHSQLSIPSKGSSLDFIVKNITLNPSGHNPLAAKVEVRLPTYGRIRVTIHGKNGKHGTISHLCHPTTPHQSIPVLGLYPDYKNQVTLTYTDKQGNKRGSTQITIQTAPLPLKDFPSFKVTKVQYDKMEPGLNLVKYSGIDRKDGAIPFMLDAEGHIRWILFTHAPSQPKPFAISAGLKRTKRGTFIVGDMSKTKIDEFDLFGHLLHQWSFAGKGYTLHHNITEASNGDFLIAANDQNAKLTNGRPRRQDHIIDFDPVGGSLRHQWDLASMLDTSRVISYPGESSFYVTQTPSDWAHNNSIKEFNGHFLATLRYQGIICFTAEGQLLWIISPHKYWSKRYQPYLLQPVDEQGHRITDTTVIRGDRAAQGFDWAWGPHDPVILSDHKILIFDNGFNRHWQPSSSNNNYSRAVEYKIDPKNNTVQQLWAYGKTRGASCFSPAHGSVQPLPHTGNILFCPARAVPTQNGRGGRIVEINPNTKEVVYEMEITSLADNAFQRVKRMPLYPKNL